MTKSETREIANITKYALAGMDDTAARAASALYRAARTARSQEEIMQFAIAYKLVSNPEWIA